MKAEMKLLIRKIITDQLDKWAKESPYTETKSDYQTMGGLDETHADLLENL